MISPCQILMYGHHDFHQIDAGRPIGEVFESVKAIFAPKNVKVKGSGYLLR